MSLSRAFHKTESFIFIKRFFNTAMLPAEILNAIFEFCDNRTIVICSRVCKHWRNVLQVNTTLWATINPTRRLAAYGITPAIAPLLQKYDAIIAGGSMLQIVLREYWPESDVDIFVQEHVIDEFLKEFLATSIERDLEVDVQKRENEEIEYTTPVGKIMRIYDIKIQNKCVQIISFRPKKDTDKFEEFVLDSFDLSICKVGYNGKQLIYNENVCERITTIKYHDTIATLRRIRKYKNRGIIFQDYERLVQDNVRRVVRDYQYGTLNALRSILAAGLSPTNDTYHIEILQITPTIIVGEITTDVSNVPFGRHNVPAYGTNGKRYSKGFYTLENLREHGPIDYNCKYINKIFLCL